MAGSTNTTESTSGSTAKGKRLVKYVGVADVRKISAADWKSVGAEGQEQVVWDAKNSHSVAVSDLSTEALTYLESDSGFKFVDPDKA